MPRPRILLAAVVALLALVAAVVANGAPGTAAPQADAQGTFARLYPDLPPLVGPTIQQIADLAQRQLDPNADADNNCPEGTPSPANGPECSPSGFTYFGQFVDHDITLDTSASPTVATDPATIPNRRTLALDLDSLYGGGPSANPEFYDGTGRFLTPTNALGVRDLPRRADGSAIINEPRNDENQIVSQIELAMMAAHNRLVDMGYSYADARQLLTWHYQWAVLHDFLPHTLAPEYADLSKDLRHVTQRMHAHTPTESMVEFSVAAYRFGHSQVRRAYEINDTSGKVQVFSATAPDLRGGQPLSPARRIDFGNFFHELTDPADVVHVNVGRRIDPLISSSLFVLPIPGAEAVGSNVLAFRNMVRAHFYGMPSGESVAREMGLTPIAIAPVAPGFEQGTPLWFYVLAEARMTQGGRLLGPVGSAIVGGCFLAMLEKDQGSILHGANKKWTPLPAVAGADGLLTVSDLVAFGGTSL
jgi:hypothetical protein